MVSRQRFHRMVLERAAMYDANGDQSAPILIEFLVIFMKYRSKSMPQSFLLLPAPYSSGH
jgi:hypothetical protein